ncbi:MAG TPA: hypothetical protein VLI06_17190 [Solimonas sp.]|nr:hypothetical protein [Solimonas sp.]
MKPLTTAARVALVAVTIYAAFLLLLALSMPPEVFKPLFAENGPFERMSILLWATLGALMLLLEWRSPQARWLGILALVFAGREADLHHAYTVMSLTKIKFYLSPAVPLMQKLVGGLVLVLAVALIVYAARLFYRFFINGGLRTPLGQVLLMPVLLLPASKIVDRFSSQLYELFGIRLPATTGQIVAAFEEGMEMAMPALFIIALVLARAVQREAKAALQQLS